MLNTIHLKEVCKLLAAKLWTIVTDAMHRKVVFGKKFPLDSNGRGCHRILFCLHKVDLLPARMCINKDEVIPLFVFSVICMDVMPRVTRP